MRKPFLIFAVILMVGVSAAPAFGQASVAGGQGGPGSPSDAVFQQLMVDQVNFETRKKEDLKRQAERKQMLADGRISPLDLQAPVSAVNEFNAGSELMNQHQPEKAARHFENALRVYPSFVSAHNALGVALMDVEKEDRAENEFQAALALDPKLSSALVNLSRVYLSQHKFPAAEATLAKASALSPSNVPVLAALAWVQFFDDNYQHAIETANLVHSLPHKDFANVHAIAGDAAVRMHNVDLAESEYNTALQEDPTGALAPKVKIQLQAIAAYRASQAKHPGQPAAAEEVVRTFPNSEHLRAALLSLQDEENSCADCDGAAPAMGSAPDPNLPREVIRSNNQWTMRAVVDEVEVMFSVTRGSKPVNDLAASDFVVRDASLPPEKIVQFASGATLPLRLGLLIDVSDSVKKRFDFEKQAAGRFLASIVTGPEDLAFAGGFASRVNVTQDFTHNTAALAAGINKLNDHGATALFDAISRACVKLAAYPDQGRVARVLVILTDGEDNASRLSLRQAIADAENTGVAVYIISTKQAGPQSRYNQVRPETDADHILQAIAEHTGGDALFPGDFKNLDKAFRALRTVIRSRYLIAYKPAHLEANGRFRPIVIKAKPGLKVHARKGYFAPRG